MNSEHCKSADQDIQFKPVMSTLFDMDIDAYSVGVNEIQFIIKVVSLLVLQARFSKTLPTSFYY